MHRYTLRSKMMIMMIVIIDIDDDYWKSRD